MKLKLHQAIFGQLAPINTGIFFRINDVFFTVRALAFGLVREKFNFSPAMGAFDIADFNVFLPSGTLSKHIPSYLDVVTKSPATSHR
jgi:hypothetical protein